MAIATAILLTVAVASSWFTASITISRVKAGEVGHRSVDVFIQSHSFVVTYWSWKALGLFDEMPEPGWHTSGMVGGKHFMDTTGAWWSLPRTLRGGSSVGPYTEWQVPLLHPLVLLGLITGWVAKMATKRDSGSCKTCGYSMIGLDAPTCPECGHTEPLP